MSCPVCFANVDAVARESMNLGILVLLGVTAGVLGCFASFFVTLARRARAAVHLVGEERAHEQHMDRESSWRAS